MTMPQSEVDLSVNLAGLALKNPVMPASGTFGYGREYAGIFDLNLLGAIVVKGISLQPVAGNPPPRLVEVTAGILNAIGLQNPGFDAFVADYLPFLRQYQPPLIVNIWGKTQDEYVELARRFDSVAGVHGLELNISCPNIKAGGISFGVDPATAGALIAAVRTATKLPLIVKLPPHLFHIADFAAAAEANGADALAVTNSLPAMAIDVEKRQPLLANFTGGLTGPAIFPVALRLVWETTRRVKIPVIGMGGIVSACEAVAFIIAGATAVAVGTANFTDPLTMPRVIDGLGDYLRRHGYRCLEDLRGALLSPER